MMSRCDGVQPSCVITIGVLLVVLVSATSPSEAPDVLPYETIMMGVTSRAFNDGPFVSNCTIATTMRFHQGQNAADVSVFVQYASSSNTSHVVSVYRRCTFEAFDIATNAVGSVLWFHAAHDPLSCLASVLLATPVPDSFFPVNLTAFAHPYEPTKLVELHLFNGWSLRLFPKVTFPELLRRSTGGPLSQNTDNAVAFCSAPSGFFGWNMRVMFWGAYNVIMSSTAVLGSDFPGSGSSGSTAAQQQQGSVAVCSGDAAGRQIPILFRLDGGRLDVVPSTAEEPQSTDTLNATVRCVLGQGSADAYLFVVGTELWVVSEGTATVLTPDLCWQTPAFAKVHSLDRLVGHTYAGSYHPLATVKLTVLSMKSSGDGQFTAQITGMIGANGFSKDCTGEPASVVTFDGATGVATLYDMTSCLGQAITVVSFSFWMRMQYINGADALWISVVAGSFLATRSS